ncbi:hypothetical protein [Halomonas kalidii]|uniref:Transposase n=1 Tax=Halomonas kalidii TaxID=3043293 RepID=A0ABT6VRP7_9GAMM|nr:hypothetical protein [Halomonas kalidii]MDI5936325.1 hypothetical protein [Halomonas kalidii]
MRQSLYMAALGAAMRKLIHIAQTEYRPHAA